jgi:hypothetical protein
MRTREQEAEWENQYQVFKTWLNNQALPVGADKDMILFDAWDNAFDVEICDMASCAIGTVTTFLDCRNDYPQYFN